jgi:hypothetical protein
LVWSVRGNRLELLYGGMHGEGNGDIIPNSMPVYKWNISKKEREIKKAIAYNLTSKTLLSTYSLPQ